MSYLIKNEDGSPIVVRGQQALGSDNFETEAKDFSDKERTFTATASRGTKDRMGDIVEVEGWQLKNYRKNPIMPKFHDYRTLPAGRSLSEFVDRDRLKFQPQFAPYEEATLMYHLYRDKYLKGFSVGFMGLKSEPIEQGKDKEESKFFLHTPTRFLKHELLEISVAPVPAHPDALSEIKGFIKKGELHIPARYLQEKEEVGVEVYDNYIHVIESDIDKFAKLYITPIVRTAKGNNLIWLVYGPHKDEEANLYFNQRFILSIQEKATQGEASPFIHDVETAVNWVKSNGAEIDVNADNEGSNAALIAFGRESAISQFSYDKEQFEQKQPVLIDELPACDPTLFDCKERSSESSPSIPTTSIASTPSTDELEEDEADDIEEDEEEDETEEKPCPGGKRRKPKKKQATDPALNFIAPNKDTEPCRWNQSFSKIFDVAEVELPPSTVEYDLISKFLSCKVKKIFQNELTLPGALVGGYLSALKCITKDFELRDVRNFSYAGTESPPIYEVIQLNSKLSDDFLVKGSSFYVADKEMPLVVKISPVWYGLKISLFTSLQYKNENRQILDDAADWVEKNNFLRGESFSLSGEFLPKTDDSWKDLFLDKKNELAIKRVAALIDEKGKSLTNRGLLFIGPPGTGKTLSGRVIMNDTNATFVWVSAKDFYMIGAIGGLGFSFRLARQLAPTVLFIEDIDAWLTSSSTDLLKTEMDGIRRSKGVVTMLTSNYPEDLPDSLLDRPGRFHDVLSFDLPDSSIRTKMLKTWVKDISAAGLSSIVKETVGLSGAHIYEMVSFAKVIADEDKISLEQALKLSLDKMKEQRELIEEIRNRRKKKDMEIEDHDLDLDDWVGEEEEPDLLDLEEIEERDIESSEPEHVIELTDDEIETEEIEDLDEELTREPGDSEGVDLDNSEEVKKILAEAIKGELGIVS